LSSVAWKVALHFVLTESIVIHPADPDRLRGFLPPLGIFQPPTVLKSHLGVLWQMSDGAQDLLDPR
jgi:hypothetical protein